VRTAIAAAEADPSLETPKPDHPAFRRVTTRIIAGNRTALEAAAAHARALGLATTVALEPLQGEAAEAGRRVAATLLNNSQAAGTQRSPGVSICVVWGGETVVTLGSGPAGRGGRCQELALAAAEVLWRAGDAGRRVWLLVAGTDGRDGPTDAAGAVVSGETWGRILEAGLDPGEALRRHDAYPALDAVGALVRTGLTGTNVMDVAFGLVVPGRVSERP
jgi:hydroxypyruvate reductase